jgi:general secretion pathway protein C
MPKERLQALAPYMRHMPVACNLLLILLIAASLARVVWLLYPLPQSRFDLPAASAMPSRASNLPKLNVEQIAAANLFGQRQATAEAPLDAPDTALNLVLKGILSYGDETSSRALIADASGKEKPYSVGDDIPGGAILKAIHADRVILERNGRFETLRLDRSKSSSAGSSAPASASTVRGNTTVTTKSGEATTLAELRNELLREPGKASQYVRLQPVYSEGKLQGYRIYPGANRTLFQSVGLRAGELVTSVNGVPLDDAAKALQLMGNLRDVSELSLVLERGGETRTINLNLNQ